MNPQAIVEELRVAQKTRSPIPSFTSRLPELTLAMGYEAQSLGLELALAEGGQLCGYKMGLTSHAKQRDVNVFEPIRGYLLRQQEIPLGQVLSRNNYIHPRVEPEVAMVLKAPLAGPGVTLREAKEAVGQLLPAFEVIDSRYQNFTFKLPDVVADNTSASGFVLGNTALPSGPELLLMGIVLKKNGKIVETGAPAAVLGNPFLSVVALANSLGQMGQKLSPGMVILTGGITAAVSVAAGDVVEAVWPTERMVLRVA